MGEKGAKEGQDAAAIVEQLLRDLAPLGDVSSRKMFGGYGIFEGSTMFALVNSQGELFLKADDSNRPSLLNIFDGGTLCAEISRPYLTMSRRPPTKSFITPLYNTSAR